MLFLIAFAFIAGIVTILSPCILPILPVVLSSSLTGGKRRPLGVVIGFIVSFTFFTLFLTSLVRLIGISPDILRIFAVIVVFVFGVSLLIPSFLVVFERLFSKLSAFVPNTQDKTGFGGGIFIGVSLGLVWTPCVGPILASVISLSLTGTVTAQSFFITLAYAAGTAIPMFLILLGGKSVLTRLPFLASNSAKIQRAFGVVMILVALAILLNLDRKFQTFILEKFPNYGVGLTAFEENENVLRELDKIGEIQTEDMGKPMFELLNKKGYVALEIIPGGEWLNSEPLRLSDLRGRVVLLDFWTYTCINCIRTLPYIQAWHEKYKDDGLVVIGVHTPEFEFEKNINNLRKAVSDFSLTYPIVQDNDYATWRAYNNRYWPAKYFIDKDGRVRWTHFGEGSYDESEQVIQALLSELDSSFIAGEVSNPDYTIYTRTPELYLGYGRISYSGAYRQDVEETYTLPDEIPSNTFVFGGRWVVGREYSRAFLGSEIVLNYEAKDAFIVMRPSGAANGRVRVYLDDELVGEIVVSEDRLYELVKLPSPGKHVLRLHFLDGNVEVYAFTFG